MSLKAEVLKQDRRGRVRVPVERRNLLLDDSVEWILLLILNALERPSRSGWKALDLPNGIPSHDTFGRVSR